MKTDKLFGVLLLVSTILLVIVLRNYYSETVKTEEPENPQKTLTVMAVYKDDKSSEMLQQLVDEYAASEENIQVQIRNVTEENFQKELCISKDQNKYPDMIIMENAMTSALHSMDILDDLSDYMDVNKKAEYTLNSYNSTLVNGICYAVPYTSDPLVLFYNKDYFDSYHKEIPETFSEFYQVCADTRKLGNYNLGLAVKDKENISSVFNLLISLYGGNIRNLESENCIELYEVLEKMRESEIIAPDTISWNQNDLMESFSSGYVKSVITHLSAISNLEDKDLKFQYRVIRVPHSLRDVYLLEGQNIGITKTAHREEAMKLMDYLLQKDNVKRYCMETHRLSVRTDLIINSAKDMGLSEVYISKERSQGTLKSSYASWFLISEAISENVKDMISNRSLKAEEFAININDDVRTAIMER